MTNPFTPAEIAALRALCEAERRSHDRLARCEKIVPWTMEHRRADDEAHGVRMALAKAAVDALPRLLDEIERQAGEIERLTKLCRELIELPSGIRTYVNAYGVVIITREAVWMNSIEALLARPDVQAIREES